MNPSSSRAAAAAGQVVTFYSYKGGTGRSMALANVAWILAANGKRVLVIDWDLEAPGLHRYFAPFLLDPTLEATPGLIDHLTDFAVAAATPQEGEASENWAETYADLTRCATSLEFDFPGGGALDFVPAGRRERRMLRVSPRSTGRCFTTVWVAARCWRQPKSGS